MEITGARLDEAVRKRLATENRWRYAGEQEESSALHTVYYKRMLILRIVSCFYPKFSDSKLKSEWNFPIQPFKTWIRAILAV